MKILLSILISLLGVMASGCETADGFGNDVENAGDAISDAAEDAEDELD